MATKKIALDAGHGLKTAGKQTPDGIKEWTLNDKVRDKVVEMLKDYDVEFVFPDNNEGNVDETNTARKTMYVNKDVDVAVSIHHNAYTSQWNNATGVEVFTDRNETSKDRQLAEAIYSRLVKYTGLRGRGIKEADFTVIYQNKIPAVLVEGGFMDSTIDHPVITSDAGQTAYAKAVAEGLIEFLGLTKKSSSSSNSTTTRNYLMKGDKGDAVKAMQANLIYMGYNLGKYGADGSFGDDTDSALRKFQKDYKLTVDGKYGVSSKAKLESAVTEKKAASQKPVAPAPAPTTTYSKTQFIKDVQSAIGAKVDGIAGKETLSKTVTVSKSKNNKHAVVKAIQKYLNANGYNCGTVDGVAGSKFDTAVKAFQKANGCVADGEITAQKMTWKKLLGL